jgi:hypothetical protein
MANDMRQIIPRIAYLATGASALEASSMSTGESGSTPKTRCFFFSVLAEWGISGAAASSCVGAAWWWSPAAWASPCFFALVLGAMGRSSDQPLIRKAEAELLGGSTKIVEARGYYSALRPF